MKIAYRGGLQDGETVIFGESGLPTARSAYRAGRLHGLSSWYRPDGSVLRTSEHADGELDGETVEYDEKGKAVERTVFRRGKPAR
jgi:antitoxin component YwqK of YwqJK toxin-antitoxin module